MAYNSKYKGSEVEEKLDKIGNLATVATSGSYEDLDNKPTIPTAVTESTVSGWGFTKNTGTYSKPSSGIPKTDLASAVRTSLGKADTAIQSLAGYATEAYVNKLLQVEDITYTRTANGNQATLSKSLLPGQIITSITGVGKVSLYDEANAETVVPTSQLPYSVQKTFVKWAAYASGAPQCTMIVQSSAIARLLTLLEA